MRRAWVLPVLVIRPGDEAAAGVFGGDQTQVRHQRARMSEAMQVADLGDEGDGGDEVEAAQAHQRLDNGSQAPVERLRAQRLGQARDALIGVLDRLRYSLKEISWAGCSKRSPARWRSCAASRLLPW